MMVNSVSILDWKWLISLGRKIAVVVLWKTIFIVCLTLLSQISAILASFLPLKVIILLGSEGVPRYIPEGLSAYGKDFLIVAFSLVTVAFFVLHVMLEKVIEVVTKSATNDLLNRSRKFIIFENQDEIASSAYMRFSKALSGGVFFAVGYITMIFIYPDMVFVIFIFVMASALLIFVRIRKNENFSIKFEGKFSALLKFVASLGFFVVFGYLVLDFAMLSPPGIIVAIVTILLSRIMLQKISGAAVDSIVLTQRRAKLEPLFFHGRALARNLPSKQREDLWSLLGDDVQSVMDSLFSDHFESWCGIESLRWFQTGIRDVIGFEVIGKDGTGYLVKVYDRHRESMAIHEATIVSEGLHYLPAPSFVAITELYQRKCLIYKLPQSRRAELEEFRQVPELVRARLMWVEPPEAMIRTFARSKSMLADRLDSAVLEKLKICASESEDQENIALFAELLGHLQQYIRRLPYVFVLPDITPSSVIFTGQGEDLCVLNWGRWELDTIGVGWRTHPRRIEQLCPSFVLAQEKREALSGLSAIDVELVAFVSAFETRCSKQLFKDAMELLPRLLACASKIEEIASENHNGGAGESVG